MQEGLIQIIILRKRENYRMAYAHFSPEKVAHLSQKNIEERLNGLGIVRNRMQIEKSTMINA